jgi:hypothetical protein
MTSFRKRLGLQPRLLDSNNNNNEQFLVVRTLLFGQRERRRPTVEVGWVPSLGAPPQGGESNNNSGQRRDMSTMRFFACGEMGHYVGQRPNKKKQQ